MRVERHFAFVDLSGFTAFTDAHGDDRAVEVLTSFRNELRLVGTEHAVRIAKWLGDGCMLVSIDPTKLVDSVLDLQRRCARTGLELPLHVGMAGGDVILLEGDDYTGRAVNLASRLAGVAEPGQIALTETLADLLVDAGDVVRRSVIVKGFSEPVDVCIVGDSGGVAAPSAA